MQVEQNRAEQTWPGQSRAEQRRGELRRTDRLRHPDTAIPRRTRGGTVRQSTSKAEHSSGTAFDEAQLNSTWLDWTGCECEYECESEYWSGAGDESVDGGDDSLSSFQSSLTPFLRLHLCLCLFPGNSAFSNWNVLHHISAHYHLLLAPQRSRHFSVPFPFNAKCPSRFERVQRATCNNNNLAK